MNVARYRTSAQSALISLEEAVMGVIYEANGPIKSDKISNSLDILPSPRSDAYEIVLNVLYNLECRGLVRQVVKRGPWELTQKGLESFE